MTEEWRDIKDYEGLYQVSNLGEIKNKKTNRILKPEINRDGYLVLNLYKDKKHKLRPVHRLVAEAFILNIENKPQVNHIDGDKTNNKVENLEWITAKDNILHSYGKLNRKGISINKKKMGEHPQARKVNQYDLEGNFIKCWSCIKEATQALKIPEGMICGCCRGKYKTVKGYIWEYAD